MIQQTVNFSHQTEKSEHNKHEELLKTLGFENQINKYKSEVSEVSKQDKYIADVKAILNENLNRQVGQVRQVGFYNMRGGDYYDMIIKNHIIPQKEEKASQLINEYDKIKNLLRKNNVIIDQEMMNLYRKNSFH